MPFQSPHNLCVKKTKKKGWGVFATDVIYESEIIEQCPVLVVPTKDIIHPNGDSLLAKYVFHWGPGTFGLALGYGSLYNHSYDPNARYDDRGRRGKMFHALCDIQAGEEITVNYNGEPDSRHPVGFPVVVG